LTFIAFLLIDSGTCHPLPCTSPSREPHRILPSTCAGLYGSTRRAVKGQVEADTSPVALPESRLVASAGILPVLVEALVPKVAVQGPPIAVVGWLDGKGARRRASGLRRRYRKHPPP